MFKFLLIYFLAAPSIAQELQDIGPVQRLIASEKNKLGWIPKATVGLNLSFSSNQDVIGQTDGTSQTYGLNFKGETKYLTERSEWRNSMTLVEATSKTASLPRNVKSGDDIKYETIYLYSLPHAPAIGPFVKADVETSLFKGEDIRDTMQTYNIIHTNGSSEIFTGSTLKLTNAFRPLTTKQSVGFFWKPLDEPKFSIETRFGFGALQINAKDQYTVKGKNPQGSIDVAELKSFNQAGLEAGLLMKGQIDDKSSYEINGDFLTPFVMTRDVGQRQSPLRLTNIEFSAKLVSKITSWASFAYDYKLKIQPQLVDRTQQTHLLVLNINYSIF
jgi:hypothetical protein